MYEVTVVVPALNEEENILHTIEEIFHAFQLLHIDGQIIIINDGSTDKTGELAELVASYNSNIRVWHHTVPKGIGRSFWEGAMFSRCKAIVMLPGDGENYVMAILHWLPLLSKHDMIVPFVVKDIRPFKRRVLSKLYRFIVNKTFNTNFRYTNGTVLYKKEILDKIELNARGFFYQTELLVKCVRAGSNYLEVPYTLKSTNKSNAIGWKSLLQLIREYMYLVKETINEH